MLDTRPMVKIGRDTSKDRLQQEIETGGEIAGRIELDESLTKQDLLDMMAGFREEEYYPEILHCMALHESADEEILRLIIAERSEDSGVLSAVVTSPRASRAVLLDLAGSSDEMVQGHAQLGVLKHELDNATPEWCWELFQRHAGDAGINLGVRQLLAHHERTPRDLLAALAEDEADFIAELARSRLNEPNGSG
jgi:hypothetical protein